MKHFISIITAFFLLVSLSITPLTTNAQAGPCDTCTATWGAIVQKVYVNQTVQGHPPTCTFDVYLEIQTRMCNGILQIRLISYNINSNNGCPIYCHHASGLMDKATKLLLQEFGGHVVISRPSSCYYTVNYEATPALEACIGAEAQNPSNLTAMLPCGTSCCTVEYILNGNDIEVLNTVSDPCTGSIPSPLPTSITVYFTCNGVRTPFIVLIVPPAGPLTCENTCSYNNGDIFQARPAGINKNLIEKDNKIYPNPTGSIINISDWQKWEVVKIYDVLGALVLETKISEQSIDISSLPHGNYKLILINGVNATRIHTISKEK